MIPEIFRISITDSLSIPLFSFGLMMLLCFLGALFLLQQCLREAGEDPALAEPLITYAAVGGIVGARLLSLISNVDQVIADPLGVIFSSAGFVFYGGFIGGVLGVYIFLKKNSLSFMKFMNIVAAPLAFGYAIGRLGCQLSGDGDYGEASNLPWAMNYKYGVVPVNFPVHPTPVYESIYALGLAVMLRSQGVMRKLSYPGQLFGLYLLLSACARFLVEFLRVEPIIAMNFTQAQLIAIPIAFIGVLLMFRGRSEA